jgi:hypothetical protein
MVDNAAVMVSDICWNVSCRLSDKNSGRNSRTDSVSSVEEISSGTFSKEGKEEGKELGDESTTTSKVS